MYYLLKIDWKFNLKLVKNIILYILMLKYCLIPFLLTTFVSIFDYILPKSILTIELISRIYFSFFASFIYSLVMYINLFYLKPNENSSFLFILNSMSMINYMNGKTFIERITDYSDQIIIDNIIFMLFTCSNLLTICYIIKYRLLKNNNGIRDEYTDSTCDENDRICYENDSTCDENDSTCDENDSTYDEKKNV